MANDADDKTAGAGAQQSPGVGATPAAPPAKQTPPPADEPIRYTREVWKEHAKRAFKVSPHAVHGALHDAGPDDTFTEDQVRERLQFLTQPLEGPEQ